MGLNKAGGEMYPWADWTWNPLAGKCPHDCKYCYMKSPPVCWSDKYKGPQRIHEREMNVNLSNLGLNRREELSFTYDGWAIIFVCSGNDLGVAPRDAKKRILRKCWEEPKNWYLLQSKNPAKFLDVKNEFPPNVIIGTTIETNRADLCRAISNAPSPQERANEMKLFRGFRKMVSIEPKMDCDPEILAALIREIGPDFVSIGADSKGHNLPEPNAVKVFDLINRLEKFTSIKKKGNLERLLGEGEFQCR